MPNSNLVNNSNSIGDRLAFTSQDILCCPPPLFHCFGLVLGVLAVITHGAKIILPAETFDASAVLRAVSDEKCTALHGVPTMFEEILSSPRPEGFNCDNLRTGIIAGAPVPRPLMKRLLTELNMREYTSSYGGPEQSGVRMRTTNTLGRFNGNITHVLQCIHIRYHRHPTRNRRTNPTSSPCEDHRSRRKYCTAGSSRRTLHFWIFATERILEKCGKDCRSNGERRRWNFVVEDR